MSVRGSGDGVRVDVSTIYLLVSKSPMLIMSLYLASKHKGN